MSTTKIESFYRTAVNNPSSRGDGAASTQRSDDTYRSLKLGIKVAVETDTTTETDGYALRERELTKYEGRQDSSDRV